MPFGSCWFLWGSAVISPYLDECLGTHVVEVSAGTETLACDERVCLPAAVSAVDVLRLLLDTDPHTEVYLCVPWGRVEPLKNELL